MSSLRLALKQSLQESGGGAFSSGHGDKKKRKKKKSSGNGNGGTNLSGNGSSHINTNGNPSHKKKERRDGESDSKRKRGRPRKPDSSQDDDDLTLGEDQPRRRDRPRDRPRTSKRDLDEDDEDDEFQSENEFSYTDDDSGNDSYVSEGEEDDDESPYRSRTRVDYHEDEDGEEDETMHSDEDDLQPQSQSLLGQSKRKEAEEGRVMGTASEKNDRKEKQRQEESDAQKTINPPDVPASESKSFTGTSSESATPSNGPLNAVNADDEIVRKKLKLIKLKKKLEKSQYSAAHKIQTQWKKKVKTSSKSNEPKENKPFNPAVAAPSNTSTSVTKEKIRDSKEDTRAASPKPSAGAGVPSKLTDPVIVSKKKLPQDKDQSASVNVEGSKKETSTSNKETSSGSATTTKSSTSSAAAGDRDNTGYTDDGVEQPTPAKKKKKKKNSNGIVPAPTREVREWLLNLSQKKSRKNIQVGMRVKVRFATQVKRDGKIVQKKIYYGGRVTAVSTKRSKIKIKYDDGTSELSKFPDRDVVVDAVDNGEHSVLADMFAPPSKDSNIAAAEEEVELPNPSSVAAAVTPAVTETEEGEVEEVTKPESRVSHLNPSDTDGIRTAGQLKKATDETTASAKAAVMPTDTPFTTPSRSTSSTLSKNEKTNAIESSSKTQGNVDVQMKPVPSPSTSEEEGELSPGITVPKSSENASEQHRDELAKVAVELKPLPTKDLLSSKVGSEKTTTEAIKFSADKQYPTTSKGNNIIPEGKTINAKTVTDLPTKPKKLSIRIPSNSLLSVKNLNSPKNISGKSPNAVPTNFLWNSADSILTDTPESKKEIITKRKRTSEDAAPSLDVPPVEDLPAKQKKRIKVTIGKNLLESSSSKTQANDGSIKATLLPLQDIEDGLVEEDLAPIAEEAISAVETKKKKKRADRAKSPKLKSPTSVPEPNKINSKNNSSEMSSGLMTPKQKKIGSKGSAFSEKKSIVIEEGTVSGPAQTTLNSSESLELAGASASIRIGRKAAEEAKEKLSVKQKAKLSVKDPKEKDKKKRRREKEAEESDTDPNETEWVQCDSCKKWRVLPDNVKASSLPDLWYCVMNTYDIKRSTCEAPEQNMKQILRERKKRARKRAKREAELAESQQKEAAKKMKQEEDTITPVVATSAPVAITSTKKKSKQEKASAAGTITPRSISPKLSKAAKASANKLKEAAADTKKAIAVEAKKFNIEGNKKSKVVVEIPPNPTDSGSDNQKEAKKKSKKGKKELQESSDNQDADAADKKSNRKRGRPTSRNQPNSVCAPASSGKDKDEDEDNVEWVQCDKCEKWRKLPPDISADELPDIWNCSMNTWNPKSASCDAAEDKTDSAHQEVGASEWQLRQAHAGKYSFRQLIFGTGARKHNRPMSERSRAAESLFVCPSTDEEHPYPTTQYAKSSAFLPRVSNFQKNNGSEDNALGIFDVLQHSNLWEDLRTMEMKPAKVLSTSTGDLNIPGQKLKTYECLSHEIKIAMQDVVLQTLEFGCLTGEEVIRKTQWFPYQTSIKGVAGIRGYCNEDIIVHTLLTLVQDSLVEMASVRDPFRPVSQWVPRYRRVGTRRALEAVEAIKASRCMKIAKPWKQRSTESKAMTEWVTGQKAS